MENKTCLKPPTSGGCRANLAAPGKELIHGRVTMVQYGITYISKFIYQNHWNMSHLDCGTAPLDALMFADIRMINAALWFYPAMGLLPP